MKLLVAIDGSDNALRAARFAASLLEQLREPGSITLISVHDDVALRNARRFVGKQVVDEYLRDLSEQDLAGAREMLDGLNIPYDCLIRVGPIANDISQAADPERVLEDLTNDRVSSETSTGVTAPGSSDRARCYCTCSSSAFALKRV